MDIVLQPGNSKICGHCCVAMITGKSVEDVINVIGHRKGTTTKELRNALLHFGIKSSSERLQLIKGTIPDPAIVKLKYKGISDWHWVVYHNGLVFCPSIGIHEISNIGEGRLSSYLAIHYSTST